MQEVGVGPEVCTVFPGECLSFWSRGQLPAPLHYVNEGPRAEAAQNLADGRAATRGAASAEGQDDSSDGDGDGEKGDGDEKGQETVRHSWPFFFRSPGHAILSDSAERIVGTADFVEEEVFGQRAWRRPKDAPGERPEY